MKILKNPAVLYVAGSFLIQGVNLLTTPIFTRLMTTSDYGVMAVYTLWVAIFGAIIGLQINGSLNNALIQYGPDALNKYMSSVMTLSVFSFVFFFALSLLFQDFLGRILQLEPFLVPIMVVQCFFAFTISFMNSKFVATKQPMKYFLLSAFNTFGIVALSMVFVIMRDTDKYLGRVYGNTIVNAVLGLCCLVIIMGKGRQFINLQFWKFCLPMTLPLIVHTLSNLVLNQADRYMLTALIDDTTTGIYSFAYTLGSVISVIWMAINNAWVPWFYEKTKNGEHGAILSMQKLYNGVMVALTLGFILISPEFVRLMGSKDFSYGAYLTPVIAAGCFFMYLYSFAVNYEFYHRKTVFISIGTLFAALLNILLNFLMIPRIGSMGAAVATLISYILLFIFHYCIAAFIIKGFMIPFRRLMISGLMVLVALGLFYLCFDLWPIRWAAALGVAGYLLKTALPFIKKNGVLPSATSDTNLNLE